MTTCSRGRLRSKLINLSEATLVQSDSFISKPQRKWKQWMDRGIWLQVSLISDDMLPLFDHCCDSLQSLLWMFSRFGKFSAWVQERISIATAKWKRRRVLNLNFFIYYSSSCIIEHASKFQTLAMENISDQDDTQSEQLALSGIVKCDTGWFHWFGNLSLTKVAVCQ